MQTPENFEPALDTQRSALFVAIGEIAQLPTQGRPDVHAALPPTHRSHKREGVDAEYIPSFIRERLPDTDNPTSYRVLAISRNVGSLSNVLLGIFRSELHPGFSRATRWEVRYTLDQTPMHMASRLVRGEDYDLPVTSPAEPDEDVIDYLRRVLPSRLRSHRSQKPTKQTSGPWPAGLVEPEAGQLLEFIDYLKRSDA